MTRLIFGCGYLGNRVAERWLDAGERVVAVTRSPSRSEEFHRRGIDPLVADVTDPASLTRLPVAQTVLYAVGMDRSSGKSMREVYVQGLRNVLEALPPETGRIIYISSSGVFGQSDGSWVDETSPCQPQRENGQVCLEAERTLMEHPLGERSVILRLSGIYGPGRVPNVSGLRRGEPLRVAADGYLNLIHVDDAARAVLAVESCRQPSSLYLVSDGHPVLRRDYYAHAAKLLGQGPPTFADPDESTSERKRGGGSKRISNRKMLEELQITLAYPDYQAGLSAALGDAPS